MSNYFTDRVVQHPGRIKLTPVTGQADTYDMERAEGTVTTPGTPFNAATFDGVAQDIIDQMPIDGMHYGTSDSTAGSSTKTVSCAGFQLFTGAAITVKFTNESTYTGTTYLNVNSTGAKAIRFKSGSSPGNIAGLWAAGASVTFIYDGNYWLIPNVGLNATNFLAGEHAGGSVPANGYTDFTVQFGRTFRSVPIVVASLYSLSSAGAVGSMEVSVMSATTSSFQVRIFNAGSSSRSPGFRWMAYAAE